MSGVPGCMISLFSRIHVQNTIAFWRKFFAGFMRGLKLKKDKYQFGQTSVKFRGHVVSAQGTDPEKARAVRDFSDTVLIK